jgi:GNAT superfamily N-acetyltransferase
MSGRDEVAVRPVLSEDDEEAFRRMPRRVMRDVEHWRPDPHDREGVAFDPERNPLHEHAEMIRYVAERSGEVVGRVAAWTDDRAPAELGFFGFYDAIDDLEAGRALLWAAFDWCRARGRSRVRGPISFWPLWSAGALIEGHERPNVIGIHHGRSYYADHFEAAGATRAAELYVWQFGNDPVPHPVAQIRDAVLSRRDIEIRHFRPRSSRDWQTVTALYRESYVDDEWYFDLSTDELRLMAGHDVDPAISALVYVDGGPVAMSIGLRNTPETALRIGRMIPPDSIQRVWHTGPRRSRSWRQWLFAVAPSFRGRAVGGLGTALYAWLRDAAATAGYERGEVGWTAALDDRLNRGLEVLGATRDRTYCLFEAAFDISDAQKSGASPSK